MYQYCSKCGSLKELNKNSYCKSCSKAYFKRWRIEKVKSGEFSKKDLKTFVERVVENDYNVEFDDLNSIISWYGILTDNIEEFNDYPVNKQIVSMWEKIYNYYKENIVQKNI